MNFTNKNYTNVLRIFHHISFITYMDYINAVFVHMYVTFDSKLSVWKERYKPTHRLQLQSS